jgi:geranylgeranyl diphosphate synthase type I
VSAPDATASPPIFPPALLAVASRVELRVEDLIDAERARWSSIAPELTEPLDALADLVRAGGKRLRPSFCHVAFVGAGGDPDDPRIVDAAAALELVHTFALVHDDVMDGSDQRRGRDAVHRRFVRHHEARSWRGEARRFGEGMAILVGDFAVVYADRLLRGAPARALEVFDDLRVELCIGQALDLAGAARPGSDLEAARRVASFKSAKYTVERPLHLGAALAGRLDELAPSLSAVGVPLGRAFQLRDDILGVFGDAQRTGKPVGQDLREGKPTPLVAIAFERSDAAGRAVLERMGTLDVRDDDVHRAHDLLVDTGAVDEVEAEIAALVEEALAAVDVVPIDESARALLADLALYVAWRDR